MHKKQFYEAPEAEMLMVRFEEEFLNGTYDPNGIEKGNDRNGEEEGFFFE